MNLRERLKEYEGTKAYQTKLGYYRDGTFRVYKDSLGKNTIGHGHLGKVRISRSFLPKLTR